jgi:hypothetical protein
MYLQITLRRPFFAPQAFSMKPEFSEEQKTMAARRKVTRGTADAHEANDLARSEMERDVR